MTGVASYAWAHVIGLTLLHGVWQGALVALAAAVLMRAAGPAAAEARHAIACGALALLVGLGIATAVAVLPTPPEETAAVAASPVGPAQVVRPGEAMGGLAGVVDRAYGFAWPALPWIAVGWLVGVAAFGLRLGLGIAWTARVRRTGRSPEPYVEARARSIARRMGLRRGFRLVVSRRVEVPTVVGWRGPVVLVPGPLIERLTDSEIDALLAHELGHVARSDGLLALVQSIAETVLFHHPAAWWLGRVARVEREHRCDDDALETCGDLPTYVRALAELETMRPAVTRVGLAATGGSLVDRVRRLVGPDRARWSGVARVAGSVLALVLLAASAWIEASVVPDVAARPGGRMAIAAHDPAGRFGVVVSDGRVLAVGVDAAPLTPDRWVQRADRLVIHDVDGDERFTVALDEEGLSWEPRPESWGR